jgi:ribosomal-protein-alanine N-acetyltransferase
MLKGTTISLRPVTEADVDELHATALDLETRGPWYPLPSMSLTKFRASFAESGLWTADAGQFLIVDGNGQKLGLVGWGKKQDSYGADVELSYRLFDRSTMGKGVATEAVNLLVDYLFDWLPIHRLMLFIHVDNVPSHRVAEKCGFVKEGTSREEWFHRGAWHDLDVYTLIRRERDARRSTSA